MDAAEAAVKLMVPGAIKRVGCNRTCCYGPGPDIEIYMPSDQPDGSAVIEAFVDFDFGPPQD